jgi:sugar lactone lactonase YvrE
MSDPGRIARIDPQAGIAGGEVSIEGTGFDTTKPRICLPLFDGVAAHVVGVSTRRLLAVVPELNHSGKIEVAIETAGGRTPAVPFTAGTKLADEVHPVANPAFDPEDGSLYVTRSGSRGQQMSVSIYRVSAAGEMSAFSGEIVNPTGIAFSPSGEMFVTSRMDGIVYRITAFNEVIPFARDLGVATGLAFDRQGRMYVGDRTGTIYRVSEIGEEQNWAQLEPSVSAYHLAFGPDEALYVTGPTVSSHDAVMRIDAAGDAQVFYKGLGRPQGVAFDREGNLYVAASYRARRGIVKISPDARHAELVVAGMNVVGLAFGATGEMVVATNDSVYSLPLGIEGTLVR